MERDHRYHSVKASIEKGYLTEFTQILDIIPKTTLTQGLKISNYRMASILAHVEMVTMAEIYAMSSLFDVEFTTIMMLIHNEYTRKKSKRTDRQPKTK
jgi:hypothetical protein